MHNDHSYRLVQKSEFISRSADGNVRWVNFFPRRKARMADPALVAGAINFDNVAIGFSNKTLSMPEAGVMTVENCRIVGYGLVKKNDNILTDRDLTIDKEEIGVFGYFGDVTVDGDCLNLGPNYAVSREFDSAVLLIRRGDVVHGHWLLEILPKIPLAQRVSDSEAVYVISAATPSYQIEMLCELGIPAEKIVKISRNEIIRCRNLLIPSVAHTNQYWLNPFANIAYDRLIDLTNGPGEIESGKDNPSKIFITRSSRIGDPRPVVDSNMAEDVAREMGYVVIDPGIISRKKQIQIFKSATKIVGYAGSGLHNTVFTGSDATVLTIQSNQTFNYLQTSIATIRGHKVGYLFGEALDGFDSGSWETAFKIDERLLRLVLDRFL